MIGEPSVLSTYRADAASADGATIFYGGPTTGKMVAFFSHGLLGNGYTAREALVSKDVKALAKYGFFAYSANWTGPAHWSNDAALTMVDTALTWCNAQYGTRTDKYVICGDSMGGMHGLNKFWRDAKAAACWVRVPPLHLEHAYMVPSLTASMDSAYGGTFDLAERQTRDPNFAANRALLTAKAANLYVVSTTSDELFAIADARAWAAIVGCRFEEYPGTHISALTEPATGIGAEFLYKRCLAQGLL